MVLNGRAEMEFIWHENNIIKGEQHIISRGLFEWPNWNDVEQITHKKTNGRQGDKDRELR